MTRFRLGRPVARCPRRAILTILAALAPVAIPGPAGAQASAGWLEVFVSSEGGAPLAGASVVATMAPDRRTARGVTGQDGHIRLPMPTRTVDLLLAISRIGLQPAQVRVHWEAGTAEAVSVRMQPIAAALDVVRVEAARSPPGRNGSVALETGAAQSFVAGVSGSLPPDREGTIADLLGSVPGIATSPEGQSALGVDPSQNQATLNGLSFSGVAIPRELRPRARVSTAAFDPSRGGFAGAQIALELAPGSEWNFERGHLTFDAPPLQLTGPFDRGYNRLDLGFGGEGQLVPDRVTYNAAFQLSRSRLATTTLETVSDAELAQMGISPDSIARLRGIEPTFVAPGLRQAGDSFQESDNALILGRIDLVPQRRRSAGVLAYAAVSQTDAPTGGFGLTADSHGARLGNTLVGVQFDASRYFGDASLEQFKLGVSSDDHSQTPSNQLPEALVQIAAAGPDSGAFGTSTIVSGGAGFGPSSSRRTTIELFNDIHWFSRQSPHEPRIAVGSRLSINSQSQMPGAGSYLFSSLADYQTGRAASFTRTVDPDEQRFDWVESFVSLGDQWQATRRLSTVFGVRLEDARPLLRASGAAQIDSAYGATRDAASTTVSPRIGFTWLYGAHSDNTPTLLMGPLGTQYGTPQQALRGGVGMFRGPIDQQLLAQSLGRSSNSLGPRSLRCVGDASPPYPTASAATTAPTQCADGSVPGFSELAPSPTIFQDGFRAPRSWRAALGWSGHIPGIGLSLDGALSYNEDQPSLRDANLVPIPSFLLTNESNRPIYVSPPEITSSSGTPAPGGSRIDGNFNRVTEWTSDGRSIARQLTAQLVPLVAGDRFLASVAYTYQQVAAYNRGFNAPTGGDPDVLQWNRSPLEARHQVQIQAGYAIGRVIALTASLRLRSGLAYTPMVNADINGDGFANDAAFVFDPRTVSDTSLGNGLRRLLATAPASARSCLSRQIGRIAARYSCVGPWIGESSIRAAFINPLRLGGANARVSFFIVNPLGLLVGQGLTSFSPTTVAPDPVLLDVLGFDPTTRIFRYSVNPQFGRSAGFSGATPARITLDVSLDFSTPLELQQLRRWMRQGRGNSTEPRLSADQLAARYARSTTNVYARIQELADSLLLSDKQQEAIALAESHSQDKIDLEWHLLARNLSAMGDSYAETAALALARDTERRVLDLMRAEAPRIRGILTPVQWKLLPSDLKRVLSGADGSLSRVFVP